jgi:vacuolar-type H+-ATPase catalytic subunit A/Vma1
MSEEEKRRIAEFYRRRQEIEPLLQEERLGLQKTLSIAAAIAQFNGPFRYSLTLPLRETSGLVQYYLALAKVK